MPKKPLQRKRKINILRDENAGEGYVPDFRQNITWRIFRIMSEFIDGFHFLADFSKEITIFGSARLTANNKHYKEARLLSKRLGKAGYTIITGGGPGIMEAGNRGATEAGAESVGLNIQLPHEQRRNKYVNRGIGFSYFFTRKVMLSVTAQAYVFFPGGYGTLDEFFEIVTLIQTNKMPGVPVILIGRDYWDLLDVFIQQRVYREHKAISAADMKLYTIVDTIDEAFEIIEKSRNRPWKG